MAYSTLLAERLAKSTAQLPNPPRTPSARAPAKSYIGKYKSEYNGVTIKVMIRNNRLAIERAGQVIPLAPINDWEFQGDSQYLTYQFFFDEKNKVVGVTDYTSYYAKEEL